MLDASENCEDESEAELEAECGAGARVRDSLARKYSYKQAMCIGAFSDTVIFWSC